jgi:hypothetical protein
MPCQVCNVCWPRSLSLNGDWYEHFDQAAAAIAARESGARGRDNFTVPALPDPRAASRQVFDGRAEVEEFNVESSDKKMHIEGLATRFYNPDSHQWSIWWANAKDGAMYPPPVVGEFKNGRGEFYDQEVVNGRVAFTRYVWTATATKSPHFEQSISTDGGKTWELWWVTDQTKDKP